MWRRFQRVAETIEAERPCDGNKLRRIRRKGFGPREEGGHSGDMEDRLSKARLVAGIGGGRRGSAFVVHLPF